MPVGIEGLALAFEHVFAVLVVLVGGAIERQHDVLGRRVARRLDGAHDVVQRLGRRAEIGGEAALVADIGGVPGLVQRLLERLEYFRAHPYGVRHGPGGDRHDHEFLDVDRIVRMRPAVDDVHHRHRHGPRVDPADIAIERQAGVLGRGLGVRQRHAEDRIGAEPPLVGRPVEVDHHAVDTRLVLRIHPGQQVEDLAVHRVDRAQHPLAAIALLVAIAQLDRLMRPGRRSGRHRSAAESAALQGDVDFDGGVAAAVEDLAAMDIDDCGHFRGARFG